MLKPKNSKILLLLPIYLFTYNNTYYYDNIFINIQYFYYLFFTF